MIESDSELYTVKTVSELAGITVRTLHHYDHIGLLEPERTTDAGYRLYGTTQLERLQQILFYRELGFPLEEIRRLMSRPDFDRMQALRNHRAMLVERKARLDTLLHTIDTTIISMQGGTTMAAKELFDGFDVDAILAENEKYEDEMTKTYDAGTLEESKRKTAEYSKADWGRVLKRGQELVERMAGLLDEGVPAEDPRMQELVGEHHRYIHESFYECSEETYRGLGRLYVSDPRFAGYFEKFRQGLAQYVSTAIERYTS